MDENYKIKFRSNFEAGAMLDNSYFDLVGFNFGFCSTIRTKHLANLIWAMDFVLIVKQTPVEQASSRGLVVKAEDS